MLSSRTIRALALLLISAVFFNIALYMFWWLNYQQLQFDHGIHYTLRKFYQSDDEVKDASIDNTEEFLQTTTEILSYTVSIDLTNVSNDFEENLNYGTTITPEATTGSSTLVLIEKRRERKVLCNEIPGGVGLMPIPLHVNTSHIVKSLIEPGGYFKLVDCRARQRIAILVTLRYGEKINESFFIHMHTFLIMQESEYYFFVIAQNTTKQTYSQGRLFNVGFLELRQRFKRIHCFVVHEKTVLPVDSKNLYRCTWYPRQLAVAITNTDKSMFYPKFGYAVALTTEQIYNANGFTNEYWTHNSGYDNMYERLIAENYVIERSPAAYGNYFVTNTDNKLTYTRLRTQHTGSTAKYAAMLDGLSTLSYTVACYEKRDLYTYISVMFPEDYLTSTSTEAID